MPSRIGSRIKAAWNYSRSVVEETVVASEEHNLSMMASSMAFWLVLTLAPFVLVMSILGQVLVEVTGAALTPAAAAGTFSADAESFVAQASGWPAIVTLIIVIFSASSLFTQFALAISRIWDEKSDQGAIRRFARQHLLGFVFVGILALVLLASILVGGTVVVLLRQVAEVAAGVGIELPGLGAIAMGRLGIEFMAAFGLFLFAFSLLPERKVLLRDAVPGALVTGAAYAVGQLGLSVYLSSTSRVTMAGSLGGLIGVLLWVYYTSMIALYGAEFTRVVVQRREARRAARG
jgi:membrane protein